MPIFVGLSKEAKMATKCRHNKRFSADTLVKVTVIVHVSKRSEFSEVAFSSGEFGLGRGRYSKAYGTVTYTGKLNLMNIFDLFGQIATWDSGCLQAMELNSHKIELWYD